MQPAASFAYEEEHKQIVHHSGRETLEGGANVIVSDRLLAAYKENIPNLPSIPVEPFTFPLDITVQTKTENRNRKDVFFV
jgi:hypothetical protein